MIPTADQHALIFRTSKAWKWFFTLCVPPLVILFSWGATQGVTLSAHLFLGVLCGGFAIFFTCSLIAAFNNRVEIASDAIRVGGVFGTKSLPISAIKGFRIFSTNSTRWVLLEPNDPRLKKIKIELIIERQEELFAWLEGHLTNLDREEYLQGLSEISQNEKLGTNPEEKAETFRKVRKRCSTLQMVSLTAFFWVILYPSPYKIAIWTLVLLPFIALWFLYLYRGIAKFDAPPKGAYPSVDFAFLGPGLGLSIRALMDFNILQWNSFLGVFTAIGGGLFIFSVLIISECRKKVLTCFLWLFFCAVYGYGTTLTLNGILANEPPLRYYPEVLDKEVCHGKPTIYYLKLASWREGQDKEKAQVARSVYNKYNPGDKAEVMVQSGKFGIPFYFVR